MLWANSPVAAPCRTRCGRLGELLPPSAAHQTVRKERLRRGRYGPTGSRRWHGRGKYQHSENRKSQLQSRTSSSSLAQPPHVTACNPAQSKGKPESSRFSEVLMIFGNRFMAGRCAKEAIAMARHPRRVASSPIKGSVSAILRLPRTVSLDRMRVSRGRAT